MSNKFAVIPAKAGILTAMNKFKALAFARMSGSFYSWFIRNPTLSLLAAFSALIFLRVPRLFTGPRFFAEEGGLYFAYAWRHSFLDTLLTPHLGYYSLVNNIAAAIAALVPLKYAPAITLAFAFSIYIAVALLILAEASPFKGNLQKSLALLLVIITPPCQGIWLTTANSQFYLCVATMIILLSNPRIKRERYFHYFILALAGLTGAISLFLVPLFFYKFRQNRSPHNKFQLTLLLSIAIIQLCVFILNFHHDITPESGRLQGFRLDIFFAAIYVKNILIPFTGPLNISGKLGDWLEMALRGKGVIYYYALSLSIIGSLILFSIIKGLKFRKSDFHRPTSGTFLLLGFILVTALCIASGTLGDSDSKIKFITRHNRYFYATNVFLGFSLLLHSFDNRRKIIFRMLFALFLVSGTLEYLHPIENISRGPKWKNEVKAWGKDHSTPVHIWPKGWPPLDLKP